MQVSPRPAWRSLVLRYQSWAQRLYVPAVPAPSRVPPPLVAAAHATHSQIKNPRCPPVYRPDMPHSAPQEHTHMPGCATAQHAVPPACDHSSRALSSGCSRAHTAQSSVKPGHTRLSGLLLAGRQAALCQQGCPPQHPQSTWGRTGCCPSPARAGGQRAHRPGRAAPSPRPWQGCRGSSSSWAAQRPQGQAPICRCGSLADAAVCVE